LGGLQGINVGSIKQETIVVNEEINIDNGSLSKLHGKNDLNI